MRTDKNPPKKADKKIPSRVHKRGVVGYSKKSALLEEAITYMNAGKYGRSSAALKELLALDPHNTEARRLFATLHVRLGSLVTARQAFESLANDAIARQDFWLAESLLREYLAAGPRCVPFLELLAHVYEEKGDIMAAVAELGKAIDILIEDPESDPSKKPSQLYAKVRELAPASSVACQFASLFDIQTGEFLRPHPVVPAPTPSGEGDGLQPPVEILLTPEASRSHEVMPWEQLEGGLLSLETPPSSSPNLAIELLDIPEILSDSAQTGWALQEQQVPPSEPVDSILETDFPGQDTVSSVSDLPSTQEDQAFNLIVAEPQLPASENRNEGIADPIVERSSFADEGLTLNFSVERTDDIEMVLTPSVESPGLSSPMPWEQIERSTITIEEPFLSPFVPAEGASPSGIEPAPALSATTESECALDQSESQKNSQGFEEASEPWQNNPPASPSIFPEPEASTSFIPDEPVADRLESLALEEGPVLSSEPMLENPPSSPAIYPDREITSPSATAGPEYVSDLLDGPLLGQELAESSELMLGDPPAIPAVLSESEVSTPFMATESEPPTDRLESSPFWDRLPESRELIPGDSPMSPAADPEPEVPTPSVAQSFSTIPFSWSSIFDGVWKFAIGTPAESLPAGFSKPDAGSEDGRERGALESPSEPERPVPSISLTPEEPFSLSDPEPVPSAQPSMLNEVHESATGAVSIKEPDLPQQAAGLLFEESTPSEVPPALSSDTLNSATTDVPVSLLSEPFEPANKLEPVSFPSFMELPPVAPLPEAFIEPPLLAVTPEGPPVPEPILIEQPETPVTGFQVAVLAPLPEAPADALPAPPVPMDIPSHWSTGEVEVQSHRPSEKKRNWDKEKGEAATVSQPPALVEEESIAPATESPGGWESDPAEPVGSVVEAVSPVIEQVVLQEDTRPEWVRESESITFVNMSPLSSETSEGSSIESEPVHSEPEPVLSVAASAVDVLFDSTGRHSQARTQDRVVLPKPRPRFAVRIARARVGISSFVGSCFSTTRSMILFCIGLALLCLAFMAVGIGAIGLAWIVMEAPPSLSYHNLTANPPRAVADSRKNGYLMLLGFDASAERDPTQTGYERKVEGSDLQAASACMVGEEGKGRPTGGASASVVQGWFSSPDPVGQMKQQGEAIRAWATQESVALKRYQQWLPMTFDDGGYGQILSPNCGHILLVHRLYLAEGFARDLSTGLQRLETDMGSWRAALGQSKTLMMKMLAATAIQDNIAIAAGLLTLQEFDGAALNRLGKIVRPLDQAELSLRWPMQSHLVWATKTVTARLKNDKAGERPLHVALAAAMPLPVQSRSNAYADYYEAASKAVAEGRYTNLPKPSAFIRTPAVGLVDYLANPIENIIGIEPLPSWEPYVGRIVETDARLRLASLQVWIRRGAQEGDVLTRLAKAGQGHYDPFTGLPMLVNQQKSVMYSVGRDGKDQEGDPQRDIIAIIPTVQSLVSESSRSLSQPRSK